MKNHYVYLFFFILFIIFLLNNLFNRDDNRKLMITYYQDNLDFPGLEDVPEYSDFSLLPHHAEHELWIKEKITREDYGKFNLYLLSAYEYPDQIALHITSQNGFGKTVYCRYFDKNRMEIGVPFETKIFPETVAYCSRRKNTKFVSISEKMSDEPQPPIRLFDRTMKTHHHNLTVCMAPLYGDEPKWLQIAEFMEHYKLQGATMVYIWVAKIDEYSRRILEEYVRRGEAEVIWMYEQYATNDFYWHMVEIHGCMLHSKRVSKWTAVVDLDERLITFGTRLIDYLSNTENKDPQVATVIFRQQWIMKLELLPPKYINESETISHMPTQRWHNSSVIGPSGHTVKCIVQMDKVGALFIHYVRRYYEPAKTYELKPSEGIVKHYRDLFIDGWGKSWLKEIEKMGPFSNTSLDANYSKILVENTVKRVKFVYGQIA
ncbi:unnamed protein product [Caenorhabditis bovis]|uniref:Glycosyltransferase family 92 protein n=1 Tax=Caenorhabditis bovis TaxID=2654633 RepID=A0A8S1ERI8_9PELO|nr:unnamed protein product [Caenorhabditis bovis]